MTVRIIEERSPTGDVVFYPYEEGKTRAEVSVAIQWGPYQSDAVKLYHYPFAPATEHRGMITSMPNAYVGRTHAKNRREAKAIAKAFFGQSVHCMRLDHGKCASAYGGHLANLADWPEAPKCECECHA